MAGPPNPLQQNGKIARRTDVTDNVDMTDVDAELQRSRRDDDRVLTGFEFFFDFEAGFARQTAVMRADLVLSQALAELVRHALDQTTRVDKHQGRAMRFDLFDQLVVNSRPDILANDRAKLCIRHFDPQIHLALVSDVDDRAVGRTVRSNAAGIRRAGEPLPRSVSASRSSRSAVRIGPPAHRVVRARATDARRACPGPPRGSHRQSTCPRSSRNSRLRGAVRRM